MRKLNHPWVFGLVLACTVFCKGEESPVPAGGPLKIALPTANRAILDRHPEAFFMGVNRKEGGTTRLVWEGGQFGFTRAPMVWEGRIIFTQFHEGIDIAPMERDAAGEPLDVVHSIGEGTVVYCHPAADGSDYGVHLIVEHDWGCGPVYSLYAHLRRVDVRDGEKVKTGMPLGMLGHTGTGIDTARSHLHLEINLMMNSGFDARQWRATPGAAAAGRFDRLNLAGIDAAALFTALKADPSLTFPRFAGEMKPWFKVTVPGSGKIDLLRRHPWLMPDKPQPEATALEISFTAWGFPVKATPVVQPAAMAAPEVTWVEPFSGKHSWKTGGLLTGSGPVAVLSEQGKARLRVILEGQGR